MESPPPLRQADEEVPVPRIRQAVRMTLSHPPITPRRMFAVRQAFEVPQAPRKGNVAGVRHAGAPPAHDEAARRQDLQVTVVAVSPTTTVLHLASAGDVRDDDFAVAALRLLEEAGQAAYGCVPAVLELQWLPEGPIDARGPPSLTRIE